MQNTGSKDGRDPKVVLGVDDVAQNLLVLSAVLTGAGYTFLSVQSGKECLTLLAGLVPRLILLDVQMPEMDGFETCRRIRALPGRSQIPIAFLTASKTVQDVTAGLAAGGNDFIIKPFDIKRLLDRVAHWTSRSAPHSAQMEAPLEAKGIRRTGA